MKFRLDYLPPSVIQAERPIHAGGVRSATRDLPPHTAYAEMQILARRHRNKVWQHLNQD